ncbi:uncharacterized protein CDAR_216551 [Caerostris darwini]|uniref:Uncharacterized protein n=1 Tax=Caerostris darwini TaxID=1538125 RepID=A0AAV4QKZ7_9ARAC|nr:uncharacterized protein CDAR_216551 [Caerostris darwini]
MEPIIEDSAGTQVSENSDHNDVDKSVINYVQKVKLAVAVAVIRSTPKDMTPKDYATFLVQTFSSNIDSWKSKCQSLEQEVFNLEQKLEMMKLKNQIDDELPGYEICKDTIMKPISPEPFPKNKSPEPHMKESVEFVRNFILLESISAANCQTCTRNDESAEKRTQVVLKTVSNIFDYLRSEEGLKMEFDIAKKTIQELHRLLTVSSAKMNSDLVSMSLDFIDDVLVDIHKILEINKIDDQHRRSSLIQMIAEHKSLTVLVLCRLLREITVTSDFLEGLFSPDNDNFLPLLHTENIYYVLQSTEGVLKIMQQQNSTLNALKIPEEMLTEWAKTTKKSLSVLGTHFPLYCVYVWHLKSVMESLFKAKSGR